MNRTGRLTRGEAQERTAALLRRVIEKKSGGPGAPKVGSDAGVCTSQVYQWLADEDDANAPLWLLAQLDEPTFRRLLAEVEALRAELYGPALAPTTREAAALVTVGTSGRANDAIATALANDGVIDDGEAPAVAHEIRRDIAAKTTLLVKLGGAS
jgi:hypothetical protein